MPLNPDIVEQVKKGAQKALLENESLDLVELPVGEAKLYISDRPEKVIGPTGITVNGKTIYVGFHPNQTRATKDR